MRGGRYLDGEELDRISRERAALEDALSTALALLGKAAKQGRLTRDDEKAVEDMISSWEGKL